MRVMREVNAMFALCPVSAARELCVSVSQPFYGRLSLSVSPLYLSSSSWCIPACLPACLCSLWRSSK